MPYGHLLLLSSRVEFDLDLGLSREYQGNGKQWHGDVISWGMLSPLQFSAECQVHKFLDTGITWEDHQGTVLWISQNMINCSCIARLAKRPWRISWRNRLRWAAESISPRRAAGKILLGQFWLTSGSIELLGARGEAHSWKHCKCRTVKIDTTCLYRFLN